MSRFAIFFLVAAIGSLPAFGQTSDRPIQIGANNEIHAVYAASAPRIDGILDDEIWQIAVPVQDFRQLTPDEGQLPSQKSAMWIAYDEKNLYFAFRFYDTEPDKIRARNLERGGPNGNDDMVWLMLDTYNDDRNAYVFETNVLGTQDDALVTDESFPPNAWQWDGIFRSEGRIDEQGWALEYAIPFRTIRFSKENEPEMGIAVMRFLNRTSERSMWPFIPRRYNAGIFQVSQYASLKGLKDIERGHNVEIKPYIISGVQEFRTGPTATESDFTRDAGVDIKYGITSNLTLDLTINTDFAQVESDVVQLDLTRFNLFFPEKREFFLERSGLFQFGDAQSTETFFSRRIGIDNDILAGARLTGQVGKLSVGVMDIQTRKNDELGLSAANNAVARIRADVLPRTTVGTIFTNLEQGDDYNRSLGFDASSRFWGDSRVYAWFTSVFDDDNLNSDIAGSADLTLRNADFRFDGSYQNVGKHFDPALGFVRRRDMKRYASDVSYNPQFGSDGLLRSMFVTTGGSVTDGQDNEKQSSSLFAYSNFSFVSNDGFDIELNRTYEKLEETFNLRDAAIAPGEYNSNSVEFGARTNGSRFLSVNGGVRFAQYFGGNRQIIRGGIGLRTGKYLNLSANINHTMFDIPVAGGQFDATTFQVNINAAQSRKLFAKALIQYDNFSNDLQANIRIDWIHSPGADLFVVLNTSYDFSGDEDQSDFRNASLNNRVGVAKLTYVIQL